MTLHPALARLERGFVRLYWQWPKAWLMRRLRRTPEGSAGQQEQARETQASLGLMAQAESAGAEMTPEQQIFLSQAEHGMRERLSVLLGIPHRSLAQEREKVAIEQWLARDAGPNLERRTDGGWKPQGFAALGAVSMVRPWMLWSAALAAVAVWGGYNDIRAGRAENQRDEARIYLTEAEQRITTLQENQARLAAMVRAADNQSREAAAAVEAERARRTRTERELWRIRNATQTASEGGRIDYGIPTDDSVRNN